MRKLVLTILILLISSTSFGAWQDTLESNFDIVSTFDELQTWSANGVGYFYYPTVNTLPKKLDGSQSMWVGYSTDVAAKSDWIGDHGAGYVWNGSKSLCINYKDLYTPEVTTYAGYGPSRLGTYFGDGTPGSGYNDMHVFFMMKFHPGFFVELSPGVFQFTPVVKLFEAMAGFSNINYWGSESEHATACNDPRMLGDYGGNDVVFNSSGGGASTPTKMFFYENTFTAHFYESPEMWNTYTNCWSWMTERNLTLPTTDFSSPYLNDDFFGVEIRLIAGTPGQADGALIIKLYDKTGNLIATGTHSNQVMIRGFAHNYNKWVFGGNYNTGGAAYTQSNETRYYVDDFIIDNAEIAPTYFSLLSTYNENAPEITFTTTNNQTVSSSPMTVEGTVAAVSGTLTGMTVNGTPILPEDGTWDEISETFSTSLSLSEGLNSVPFIVSDSSALSTTAYFNVTYTPAGYVAPIVEILTESQSTTEATITIIGTLTTDSTLTGSGVDVNGVTATADDGAFDEAVEAWTALGVTLSLGSNTITATGTDSDSATDTDTVSITRTAPVKTSKINGSAVLKGAVIHQ